MDDFDRLAPLTPVPLVPEIRLHRTSDIYGLWERTAAPAPPFWAIPWAGGQALARYVLDHRQLVRGRRVLDVGAGSRLVAIAAALAGATIVIAADIDARAIAAISRNSRANGVAVNAVLMDALHRDGDDADVVLVGDAFYERELAQRMLAFLRRASHRGASVLVGDIGRTYLPRHSLIPLASYDVPVLADVEDATVKHTTVFAFGSDATVAT